MQLTLIKTLFLVGTLAGVALANNDFHNKGGNNGDYHKGGYRHKGGVIKKTILIDGCTGNPIPPATPYDDVSALTGDANTPAAAAPGPGFEEHDLLNDLHSIFNDLETETEGTVDEAEDDLEGLF
ncbi:hypothetical protein [Absidia glauca]|uniref:Uncharacterized protein n=1 Tax=Absidia glauca TaxID=4829 RepID=A0A163LNF4_ABSGL|nr:hypothetical protein [Absidia glauca]